MYLSATVVGIITKNFCGQIQEYVPTVVRSLVLMDFVILPKLELRKACVLESDVFEDYFTYTIKPKDDGGLLFVIYSDEKYQLNSTHSKLMTIKLKAIDEVRGVGKIMGISLASVEDVSLDLGNIADAEFNVNGGEFTPDANGDGVVDVADICSEFNYDVFNNSAEEIRQVMIDTPVGNSDGEMVVLTADQVMVEDGKGQLTVKIDYNTTQSIRGWNFTLYLPEGVEYKRANASAETYSSYEWSGISGLRVARKNDGGYLFAWYDHPAWGPCSLTNTHGVLLTIDLESENDIEATGEIRGIALSSTDGVSLDLGNIADVTFDIKKLSADTYIQRGLHTGRQGHSAADRLGCVQRHGHEHLAH